MDYYFSDVDVYLELDPSEFEQVTLSEPFSNAFEVVADTMYELQVLGSSESVSELSSILHKIAAKYQNRTVTLNKPFRTSDGPKKFSVYVKNDKGNVVKVNFGDPDMRIKKYDPKRRKSFRARHKCDNPGPKWKARYWSCKAW